MGGVDVRARQGEFATSRQINYQQHNTTQHNTAQHGTRQHGTRQHKTRQHNTTQHGTRQHGTRQHKTRQDNTTQHDGRFHFAPARRLTSDWASFLGLIFAGSKVRGVKKITLRKHTKNQKIRTTAQPHAKKHGIERHSAFDIRTYPLPWGLPSRNSPS